MNTLGGLPIRSQSKPTTNMLANSSQPIKQTDWLRFCTACLHKRPQSSSGTSSPLIQLFMCSAERRCFLGANQKLPGAHSSTHSPDLFHLFLYCFLYHRDAHLWYQWWSYESLNTVVSSEDHFTQRWRNSPHKRSFAELWCRRPALPTDILCFFFLLEEVKLVSSGEGFITTAVVWTVKGGSFRQEE